MKFKQIIDSGRVTYDRVTYELVTVEFITHTRKLGAWLNLHLSVFLVVTLVLAGLIGREELRAQTLKILRVRQSVCLAAGVFFLACSYSLGERAYAYR